MTRVKICGIREKTHALAVVKAGGDFIGLVFAPSRRQLEPDQAREIVSIVRKHSETTEVAGVFVNMPSHEVNRIANACKLDWVQLSGDESWEYCRQITKPIIKAVRVREGQSPQEMCGNMATGTKILSNKRYIYLLDSQVEGMYGGTGIAFDWNLARQVAEKFPLIIAGGLTPENVGQAIRAVAPWGVDVSSGVEVDGIKDTVKIRAFIKAVRREDDKKE
jgi:phosphoribosylanthranilate isomerase